MKLNLSQKLLAGILSVAMLLNMGITSAFAATEGALPSGTSGLCTHHVHDENCGYTEGTPCTFDPATCESCNPKDSNAQEIPKENIAKAETISEPAPQPAEVKELNIASGAIKIYSDRYQIYNGSEWSETPYTGSYVITGTEEGSNPGFDYITVVSLASDATLTLKDLTIGSTKNQSALSLAGLPSVPQGEPSVPEVCIEGAVSLKGTKTAMKANGALNLTGSGSLALDVVSSASSSSSAVAVVSAASLAANLTGDITVSATASNKAAIHAIKTTGKVIRFGEGNSTTETTVDGKVSLTSTGGKVALTSGGTTAPLVMSAGAVTISGKTGVAVTNAAGEIAILASGHNVSLTSEIGKVDVSCKGSSPAIQAGAVTISGSGDVSVESTGGQAIVAGSGAVSLTSDTGAVNVTGSGNGSAIGAGAVTIAGMRDIRVNNTANDGSGISAPDGEVSLTSGTGAVNVQCKGASPAIGANTLTIAAKGSVTVVNGDPGKDSGSAIVTRGAVSLTSADKGVRVYGGVNAISSDGGAVALKGKTFIEVSTKQTAQTAINARGAVALNAADVYVGGLISADNHSGEEAPNTATVTFTAPEGAMVTSKSAEKLITGKVTVAANTNLQLLGNATGIAYAEDGSEGRTTVYVRDLSGGGTVNLAGTYLAGGGTIVVAQSEDSKYTATMTNATVGDTLSFNEDCALTLVGKNQVENRLSLLGGDAIRTLTINGAGELVAPVIEADNIIISGGTVSAMNIYSNGVNGTLSIAGGTVNADVIAAKNPSITGGTVNAIVLSGTPEANFATVYGNVTLVQTGLDFQNASTFTVPVGASLTVPGGVTLSLTDCAEGIANSGTITINGELVLPTAYSGDGAIKALRLTGNGSVKVGEAIFFTDGSQPHTSNTALTFSAESADAGNLTDNGYEWKKDTKTLTLKNLRLEVSADGNAITLPDGATLVLQGVSTVIGKDCAIAADGNLTVSGATGILKAGGTIGSGGRSINVTGTLTVDSGTILSAGNNASMYVGAIEINDGTIDLGASGMMMALTTLTISGGNVTTGDNEASLCAKDIVISGGKVKTGASIQGSISAMDLINGTAKTSITITGGTVIANGGNHPFTPIGVLAMNGDISITGGTVTATGGIDSGTPGVIVGGGIAAIGGTITTTGMTAATTPVGGSVKSGTVRTQDVPMTVTSYTAEAELQAEGDLGMITNACTTVSLEKTQTPPDSGDSGGTVTPPAPKPEPPKTDPGTGNTEVSVPVKPVTKGDTSSATVPEKAVSDAIAAAEKEAAKTGGSASVTVTVDAPEGAKTVETTLSGKSLSAVADGKTEGLKISTPVADLSFDSEALKNIAGMAGKNVKISAAQVDTKALTDAQKSQVGDAPVFDFTISSGDKTISNFNGGTATVSVPYTPKDGENPDFVTVWLLDDAGKLIPIEAKYKDGKIAFETGHFSRYAIGYLPFTDVKADWAYESIVYAYQNKLFSGVGDDKFAPTANMNRAMLWTVLYRMAGSPGKTETPANWYADAQAWAMSSGISDGTNPDGNVTREQLATILFRYAKAAATAADMSGFTDSAEISAFAKDGMSWAVESKILQGNDGKLNPAGNATRAEVAAVLRRYAQLAIDKASA